MRGLTRDWTDEYQLWLLEKIADALRIDYAEAKAEFAWQATKKKREEEPCGD